MKRSGFLQRNQPLRQFSFPVNRQTPQIKAALRRMSDSPTATIKRNIQALLRELAIVRDGGCVLRNFSEAGECGGFRNDGELILQFEHLMTRANAASYGDLRLGVCLCQRHHIFWKPQHSERYWRLVKQIIGPERAALMERVQEDRAPHRFYVGDWKAIEVALTAELQSE